MRADWEQSESGQVGITLAGTPMELRSLAGTLVELSRDADQHFHITATGKGSTRVGDIEISVLPEPGDDSLSISSFALLPGAEIPDSPLPARSAQKRTFERFRGVGAVLLLLGAAFATILCYGAQAVTIAGTDYRPVWTVGVRTGCIAIVLLQAASLVARGWKLRLVALLGSLVAIDGMLALVAKLGSLPWFR